MNCHQDPAFQDSSFVPLGFIFRYSHSDESSCKTAQGSAYANSRQSRNHRSCCDDRSDAWNRQRADADEPTQLPPPSQRRLTHLRAPSCSFQLPIPWTQVFLATERKYPRRGILHPSKQSQQIPLHFASGRSQRRTCFSPFGTSPMNTYEFAMGLRPRESLPSYSGW